MTQFTWLKIFNPARTQAPAAAVLPPADQHSPDSSLKNKLAHRTLRLRRLERGLHLESASPERSETDSPPVLIFTHIPKTAGSSLLHLLRTQTADGRYHELYDLDTQRFEIPRQTIEQRVRKIDSTADVICSHIPVHYRIWEFIDRSVSNATILRDPVERLISHYSYIKTITHVNAVGKKIVEEGISLHNYVTTHLLHGSENLMVRFLASTANPDPEKACTNSMLEEAIENLQVFDILGIAEEFDDFVNALADIFSYSTGDSLLFNVNPERPQREEISQSTIDAIKERNSLDIALYEAAKKQLLSERAMK